jgi:putative phosphoribosyl transferase
MRDTRFTDLRSAGCALASDLGVYASHPQTLVLGIVRGGVPVAAEVARALSLPIDLLLLRRLLAPDGPADPITAAWVAGTFVTDERLAAAAAGVHGGTAFVTDALDSFTQRNALCRGSQAPADLRGKTILLIDNGVRTGGTVRAAVRALRTLGPARVVAAAPVASEASRAILHAAADEVVCPAWVETFGHVGMWYDDFAVPHVEQIHGMLAPEILL